MSAGANAPVFSFRFLNGKKNLLHYSQKDIIGMNLISAGGAFEVKA